MIRPARSTVSPIRPPTLRWWSATCDSSDELASAEAGHTMAESFTAQNPGRPVFEVATSTDRLWTFYSSRSATAGVPTSSVFSRADRLESTAELPDAQWLTDARCASDARPPMTYAHTVRARRKRHRAEHACAKPDRFTLLLNARPRRLCEENGWGFRFSAASAAAA
jgi:hypothetical protein